MTEPRHVDSLIKGGTHVAMLMTMIGDRHSSRPLICLDVTGDRLSFLVDQNDEWVQAIARGEAVVHLTVADERHNTYVALNGHAAVNTGLAERQSVWSTAVEDWFDSPDDPRAAVLTFDVTDGEFWHGPGRMGRAVDLLRGVLNGFEEPPDDEGRVIGSD
jgi:general stress protein 26